jgi:hypothetical protein
MRAGGGWAGGAGTGRCDLFGIAEQVGCRAKQGEARRLRQNCYGIIIYKVLLNLPKRAEQMTCSRDVSPQ